MKVKIGKKVKIKWSFNKISKREITSGIREWYWNIIVLKRIQINNPPPLDPKVEGVFVEEEEVDEEEVHSTEIMTSEGKGYTDHDKVESIKLLQTIFYDINKNMNQHLMKGFELLVSQFGSK